MPVSRPGPVSANAGFTMLEVLITTAVLSAGIYLVSGTMNDLLRSVKASDQQTSVLSLREILSDMILDKEAWMQTVAQNNKINKQSAFKCWNDTKDGCSKSPGGYFSPYGADGKLYLDSYDPATQSKFGFTTAGDFCSTYNLKVPDPKCPIRIMFRAVPLCQPKTGCFKPEFNVTMEFEFSFPKGTTPSWADSGNLSRILRTVGSTAPINLTSGGPIGCPGGFVPIGLSPNGSLICSPVPAGCYLGFYQGSACQKQLGI